MFDVSWEGKIWVKSSPYVINPSNAPTIRVISYRLSADFKTTFMHHSVHKSWESRAKLLLKEMQAYDADVFCLQDVDHFTEFWYPNFMLLGYDAIYKQRTQEKDFHYEGIAIAFKNERFQLFRSVEVEFNKSIQEESKGSSFRDRCATDDVALIAFLQPFNNFDIPTSICICCAMLNESISNQDVRAAHCTYLTQQLHIANREFQLPVIIGINLNDIAASPCYIVLRSGRQPLSAQLPAECRNISATPTSRSTALIKWLPPKLSIADPPILVFRISWRPGGSTILGFSSQLELAGGDCIKYIQTHDENGHKKIISAAELQAVIRGLAAEVPYEFRVCAVNEMGEGAWSEPTKPIVLVNPSRAPPLKPLLNFSTVYGVQELREIEKMEDADWNVNDAFRVDPVNSLTQLTPRTVDGRIDYANSKGRVLPLSVNPRTGWKTALDGQPDEIITREMNRDYILSHSLLRDKEGFLERNLNGFADDSVPTRFVSENEESYGLDGSTLLLDCREAIHNLGLPNARFLHNLLLRSAYESYGSGGEPVCTASFPKEKGLQESNGTDFLFYSTAGFICHRVLSLPSWSTLLRGETPEVHHSTINPKSLQTFPTTPTHFDQQCVALGRSVVNSQYQEETYESSLISHTTINTNKKYTKSDVEMMKRKLKESLSKCYSKSKIKLSDKSSFWGGRWVPFPEANQNRKNYYMPHSAYGSTHIAIGADFLIDETHLATTSF